VSNFPLAYKLTWLPRLLKPSLAGSLDGRLSAEGTLFSPPPEKTRRLVFLGDISAVANHSAPDIDDRLRALIGSADVVVGNCESPVVERIREPFGTAAGTRHAMSAKFLAEAIEAAGMVPERLILSLANNHMLDQRPEGFAETRAALAGLGIATIGAVEDGPARIAELDGLSVAFAAFTRWRNASRKEFAGRVIMLDDFERDGLAALGAVRADLTCVVAHWDREFRHFPQAATRQLARKLSGSGARLIVGHHAHVLQPIEQIGDALVAYGIGDFLGTSLPLQPWPVRLGALLSVEVSADRPTRGRVAAYRLTPFLRERSGQREQLVPLDAVKGPLGARVRERFEAVFPRAASTDR